MSQGSASYRMTLACGRLLMLDEINALTSRWNEALAASQTATAQACESWRSREMAKVGSSQFSDGWPSLK